MNKVPFQREIEDLFASDKSVVLKMLGGAFVGAAASLGAILKHEVGGPAKFSPTGKAVGVVTTAIIGALVVTLLLLRDVVVRRVQQGQRVNPLLRAYFGQGNGCMMLVLWFFTIMFVTIIVTVFTASLF